MEKSPNYDEQPSGGFDDKNTHDVSPVDHDDHYMDGTNEAKDVYGDIQTAEEYGYVSRGYAISISSLPVTCLR